MATCHTFEQLCVRKISGFAYNDKLLVKPYNPENYDEVIFKIISKIDTSLLILESNMGSVQQFSIDVVSLDPEDDSSDTKSRGNWSLNFWSSPSNKRSKRSKKDMEPVEIFEEAWKEIESLGCHGMHVISILSPDSLPKNNCRKKYTLGQFVNHVIHSLEAYFMFHKPNLSFSPNLVNESGLKVQEYSSFYNRGFALTMTWQFAEKPTGKLY